MTEPVVCIFPHSDDEFPTVDDLRKFLCGELRQRGGRYWLRKMKRKDKGFIARVIPGSPVLFSKKGLVVGEATVESPISELEPLEDVELSTGETVIYYYEIIFNPRSIRVYESGFPVDKLVDWSGRKRRLFPGTYAILGSRQEFETAFPGR